MDASPSLLVRLGLSRRMIWDPPTVLDRLWASPLRTVTHYLYAWITRLTTWAAGRQQRRASSASSAPGTAPIRVVCISDTHDMIVPRVPAGDLLIHAGDLTNSGYPADLQRQLDWLAAQPHAHKVVIAGNHDSWFDTAARVAQGMAADEAGPRFADKVHYLQHDACTLAFAGGRRLTVYGAGSVPRCGPASFAFQYDRSTPPWKGVVPDDTDILVTHPPPRHHLDLGLGCNGLLEEVWRVRPALHVFGHVHWGAGRQVVFWDETQRAYERLAGGGSTGLRDLVDFGRLFVAAVAATLLAPVCLVAPGVLAPRPAVDGRGSTTFVNAAQMFGNTGRLGSNVQVIDL